MKGIALLSSAFPANRFDVELYWELLNDLEDQDFEVSILRIIKTLKDIYPGTNLIALIIDQANTNKKTRLSKITAIPNKVCAPPPKEWRETINTLAKKNQ